MSEPRVTPAWRPGDTPWHPVILAVTVVVGFFVDQPVSPFAAARLLPGAAITVALVTLLLWLLLRNPHRAGVLATALVVLAWSKHAAVFVIGGVNRLEPILAVVWLTLIALAVALAGRIALRRLRPAWSTPLITRRLNALAGLLLVVTVASGWATGRFSAVGADLTAQDRESVTAAEDASSRPDVFVILLDMYARHDVLEERYGYDNGPFLDSLADRGFQVATDSRSIYPYTHLALPSLLHMDYMEAIEPMRAVFSGRAPVRPTIRLAINQNRLFDLVRDRGYEVHSVSSGYEDYTIRHVEHFWDRGELNEYELQFLESTFLGDLLTTVSPDFASGALRDRIHSTLAIAADIAGTTSPQPRFVFVHVPAPHTPIVLGPNGEPIQARLDGDFFQDRHVKDGLNPARFAELYRGEVHYLNTLVLETVDAVIARSEHPPVVIVMSDHGPSSGVDWDGTPRADLDPSELRERIATLFAASTPGRRDVFPSDVRLVDVFRHLADAYLDTDLGRADPPADGVQYDLP